jgi:ABC-type bacteriocin/lantibiotic exporter with double-glycine peptidase domain
MAELDVELNFLSQKDRTRMTDSNSFSEGQKRRICIARALYGEPDILLMDDPFMNLDNETSKIIYNRISDGLPNSLIITATHSASIIRPTDRVIILENGHVKEYDIYTRLKSSPLLHKLIEITP